MGMSARPNIHACMSYFGPSFEHDEAIRISALWLVLNGYSVQARVEGWFDSPDYIYGYRPDIVASKGNEWLIVEFKKAETDWPKINALERYEREHAQFQVLVLSPRDVLEKGPQLLNDRHR